MKSSFSLLLFLLITLGLSSQIFSQSTENVIEGIAKSHIDANVPVEKDFDTFPRRDLVAYFFPDSAKDTKAEYQLFRKEATQTGIAYPKFYAWVRLTRNNSVITEGAVRLAAIEKKKFSITDFLSSEDALKNPEAAYRIFPRPVADMIKKKVEGDENRH